MGEWGWSAVAGGGVALFVLGVWLFTRRPGVEERLTSTGPADSHTELVLGDMTDALASGLPGGERDRTQIHPELLRAGYYSPKALTEFQAIRAVLILTPLFVAAIIAQFVPPEWMPTVALVGVVGSALGYSLPRLYVFLRAADRAREIERGLPIFADMLSIALLAGQGLMTAIQRVTGQLRGSFPRMADELDIVSRQAEMLNLTLAFEQWANRSQIPEVRTLSIILGQSQRLGNDISAGLMEFASTLRTGSRQRADAKAQRASFWMLFPTILCLWIPAAVLLVGPVYFEFSNRRGKAREQIPNATKSVNANNVLKSRTEPMSEQNKARLKARREGSDKE